MHYSIKQTFTPDNTDMERLQNRADFDSDKTSNLDVLLAGLRVLELSDQFINNYFNDIQEELRDQEAHCTLPAGVVVSLHLVTEYGDYDWTVTRA